MHTIITPWTLFKIVKRYLVAQNSFTACGVDFHRLQFNQTYGNWADNMFYNYSVALSREMQKYIKKIEVLIDYLENILCFRRILEAIFGVAARW